MNKGYVLEGFEERKDGYKMRYYAVTCYKLVTLGEMFVT